MTSPTKTEQNPLFGDIDKLPGGDYTQVPVRAISLTEEYLRVAATDFVQGNIAEGVSWNKSYCDFDDGKFFCEWEAPDKETLEQVFKQIEMPFDVIYPVRIFDIATAELEA